MAKREKKISSVLKNERGATIYVVFGLLAAAGAAVFYISGMGKNNDNWGRVQRVLVEKEDLKHTVDVLLSNRDICIDRLRIHGDDFSFYQVLKPGLYLQSLEVKEMRIENRKQLNPALYSANFIVRFEVQVPGGIPKVNEISREVSFKMGTGEQVVECVARVDPQTACARVGAEWNTEQKICDICKLIGHEWSGGKCV